MRADRARPAAALALGLLTGLWGIRWGLPGPARLAVLPDGKPMTEALARDLTLRWARLYEEIRLAHRQMLREEPVTYVRGVVEVPPGWSAPPEPLLNSVRSMMLQSDHPDEKKSFVILAQMRPWRLDFKPLYMQYGGAYIYPLGGFLKLASTLGLADLVPDMTHYLQRPEEMARLYLLGRLFVLIFHLGSLWLLFDLGRRLSGPSAGLTASALFALTPLAAMNSHLLKPHAIAAFWFLAALRSAIRAGENGSARDYRLCGLFCGLAAGSAATAASVAWLPLGAWLWRRKAAKSRAELREALKGQAVAAGAFIVTNPYVLFARGDFAWETSIYAQGGAAGGLLAGTASLLSGIAASMSPFLLAACLAGAGAALAGTEKLPRMAASLLLACSAALWAALFRVHAFGLSAAGVRFYYPVLAAACLLAAHGLSRIRRPALRSLLLGAVLLDTGVRGAVYLENMRAGAGPASTRLAAARWIDANVPAAASVGLARFPEPAHLPPFGYHRYRLVVFEDPRLLGEPLPEYLITTGEGVQSLGGWERGRYGVLKAFEPARIAWARATDPSFYANVPVLVFKRLR